SLDLTASDPAALAAFYARTFVMAVSGANGVFEAKAPGRRLRFLQDAAGKGGQLKRASYRFRDLARFNEQRQALRARALTIVEESERCIAVRDPEGREV